MAKKNKRQWQEESQAADAGGAEGSVDGAVIAEEVAPAPAEASVPAEQALDLHDAARRWVPGFKEHWWPGIKRHADAMGFAGSGTEDQCKAVLRHWGAKIA